MISDTRDRAEPMCLLGSGPQQQQTKTAPGSITELSSSVWALSLRNTVLRGVHGTRQHVTYRTLVRHTARLFYPLSPCL